MSTATETKTTTVPEIKEDVRTHADLIKSKASVKVDPNNPSHGLIVVDGDVYVENLPEGHTVETVKALQDYNSLTMASGTLGGGEMSSAFMKKHPDVKTVSMQFGAVGKDTFDFDFNRSSQYPVIGSTTGEKTTKYLTTVAAHNVYGTRNVGELKKVKTFLADLGTKALAGK